MKSIDLSTIAPTYERPRPRPLSIEWAPGDAFTDPVSRIRWLIRRITPAGRVLLVATNHPAGRIVWRTSLEHLPPHPSTILTSSGAAA